MYHVFTGDGVLCLVVSLPQQTPLATVWILKVGRGIPDWLWGAITQ